MAGPVEPLVTYAAPIPDEPGSGGGVGGLPGGLPVIGAVGVGGGGSAIPIVPPTTALPSPDPVPEPSVWLMMIAGIGSLGAMLRRRRRAAGTGDDGRTSARRATIGSALWSGSAAVEAGDMAATVAVKSAMASAASKVALCVCPVAIVAGSAITVPPVRQAVHTATSMPVFAASDAPITSDLTLPCPEPMTVPVATTAIPGFPKTVSTATVGVPRAAVATGMTAAQPTPTRS